MYGGLSRSYGSMGISNSEIDREKKRLRSRINLKQDSFAEWSHDNMLRSSEQQIDSYKYVSDLLTREDSQIEDEIEKRRKKKEEEMRRTKEEVSKNKAKWEEKGENKKYKVSVTQLLNNICKKLNRFFQTKGYFINDQNNSNLTNKFT